MLLFVFGHGQVMVFQFLSGSVQSMKCYVFIAASAVRAGFSYLYSFHCFHLAPLVSRHMGQVGAESSERHQILPAA